LTVDGTHTGTVTVNGGILQGSGTITGAVVVDASSTVGPGSSPGTLSVVGTTTIDGSAFFDLDAGDPLSLDNDLLAVTGDLIFGAGSKIAPSFSGAALAATPVTYTLMTYSGTLTDGGVSLDDQFYATTRTSAESLDVGIGTPGKVLLNITFDPVSLIWSGAPADNQWVATGAAGPVNWDGALSPPADEQFWQGDSVLFDDFSDNTSDIDLVGSLTPGVWTVDSDLDFTFSGTGSITGTTGLLKDGFGTLTLLTDNTNTGTVDILDGDVMVGNGGTTGSLGGSGDIAVGGFSTLTFNRSDALALGRAVIGGGILVIDGGGSFTTVANNNVDVEIKSGTLIVRGGNWSTSTFAGRVITVENGGTMDTNTHALGGNGGATRPSVINIDDGGTWFLNNEQILPTTATNLTGGLIEGPGEIRGTGGPITHTGDVTSTIAVRLNLDGTITSDVADGAQADDMVISGVVTNGTLAKDGLGTLAMTTATADLRSNANLTIYDGTLAMRMPGVLSISNALGGVSPGVLLNDAGLTMWLSGDGSAFGGTIDGNGQDISLNGPTAGSGTGGTIELRGKTLAMPGGLTEGVLNFGSLTGNINIDPLPVPSPVTPTAAYIQGGIAGDTTLALDGEIWLPAGPWSFSKTVDDGGYVMIDGTEVINNTAWNNTILAAWTAPADGWYSFSARVSNGGGGNGPNGAPFSIGIYQGDWDVDGADINDFIAFEIGALGTNCRAVAPVSTVAMAGGLTTGGAADNTVDTSASSLSIAGPVAGSDPLVKTGTGTLTLDGTGIITGAVTVQQGTMVLGASGSIGTASMVTVDPGATLSGTGESGPTTIDGNLAPGTSIGTLSTTGNLVMGSTGYYTLEIDSDVPSADSITVTGDVDLTGQPNLLPIDLGSTVLVGVELVLIDYTGTLTGNFLGRPEGSTVIVGVNTFDLSYVGGDGTAVTLSVPGTLYGNWAQTNILDIDPGAAAGFDDDAEGDSMSNGLEWILGGDPLLQDAASLITSSGDGTNGLTLSFTRDSTTSTEATLFVDWDVDLDAFANTILIGSSDINIPADGVNPSVDITAGTPDTVIVNLPAVLAPGGKMFARLRATQP